jgi:hypothetical protein
MLLIFCLLSIRSRGVTTYSMDANTVFLIHFTSVTGVDPAAVRCGFCAANASNPSQERLEMSCTDSLCRMH